MRLYAKQILRCLTSQRLVAFLSTIIGIFSQLGFCQSDAITSTRSSKTCAHLYARIKDSTTLLRIEESLSELPTLKPLVVAMMHDPLVPDGIKRILSRALVDKNTRVINLTSDIRTEFNVTSKANSVWIVKGMLFETRMPDIMPPFKIVLRKTAERHRPDKPYQEWQC